MRNRQSWRRVALTTFRTAVRLKIETAWQRDFFVLFYSDNTMAQGSGNGGWSGLAGGQRGRNMGVGKLQPCISLSLRQGGTDGEE